MRLKQFPLIILFFLNPFCSQVFAGNIIDRFADDAETIAQTRDDVSLTPSNIPSIMAAPGIIGEVKLDHTTEILNAHRTILTTDKPILWFDCNGSDRNITLPVEASSTDLVFIIYNDSDGTGEDLVVRDDAPITLITIGPGQSATISCDGTSWKVLNDKGIYYDAVTGEIETLATATPVIGFEDSDAAVSNTHGRIYGNLTDTGDGTEDMDKVFQAMLNGVLSTFMDWDASEEELTIHGTINDAVQKFKTYNKSTCSVTLTVKECSDTLITNYGWNGTADQDFELCAAGPGLKIKFLNLITDAAEDIYFDTPGSTTQFVLDGTACGDGERVWTDNPIKYESIQFHTFTEDGSTWDWACDSVNGAWLDKGS